jgi:hypothetical protein
MEDILKKFIIILCITFICTLSVLAQNNENLSANKNELQIKLGMIPYTESIIVALANMETSGDFIYTPSVSVQYLHYIKPRIGIGTTFSTGLPIIAIDENKTDIMYTALQFKFRGIYFDKENIKLYGEVGFGGELLFSITKEREVLAPFYAGSIVPLGIWFGSDNLFGTAELTFGSEGSILTIGCGFKF